MKTFLKYVHTNWMGIFKMYTSVKLSVSYKTQPELTEATRGHKGHTQDHSALVQHSHGGKLKPTTKQKNNIAWKFELHMNELWITVLLCSSDASSVKDKRVLREAVTQRRHTGRQWFTPVEVHTHEMWVREGVNIDPWMKIRTYVPFNIIKIRDLSHIRVFAAQINKHNRLCSRIKRSWPRCKCDISWNTWGK